jgi:hypothetical protein
MTYMRQFTNVRARGHGDILPSGLGVEARGGSQAGPGEGVRGRGSGLVLDVACVMHASLVGAMLCGYQILTTRGTLSRTILREVRNEGMLQRVTIEEHQVGDLVFALLQLFIHVVEGHIDLVIVQYDVAQYNN